MLPALLLTAAIVAMPPPVCRGKIAGGYDPRFDETPSTRAIAEIQAAYDALCPERNCGSGVIYKNETIGNNAVTWVSGLRDGEATSARIVYSSRFLDALAAQFGDGASFGVLAHEVGHHVTAAKAMRGQMDHAWDEELRADYLAGCALGRSGRSPTELEHALRALAAVATDTHPPFVKRNPIVRKGYDDCKKHQDKFDALPEQKRFGIGAAIKAKAPPAGCWRYFYRAAEEIEQVGPVAAPRRRSDHYANERVCEAARGAAERAKTRITEPCTCPR